MGMETFQIVKVSKARVAAAEAMFVAYFAVFTGGHASENICVAFASACLQLKATRPIKSGTRQLVEVTEVIPFGKSPRYNIAHAKFSNDFLRPFFGDFKVIVTEEWKQEGNRITMKPSSVTNDPEARVFITRR